MCVIVTRTESLDHGMKPPHSHDETIARFNEPDEHSRERRMRLKFYPCHRDGQPLNEGAHHVTSFPSQRQ
ncbi:protein of unknown function (plasmid) [Caballeronia sp. S22]